MVELKDCFDSSIAIKNNKCDMPLGKLTKVFDKDKHIGYLLTIYEETFRKEHSGSNIWNVVTPFLALGYKLADGVKNVSNIWRGKAKAKEYQIGRRNGEDINITILDDKNRAVDFYLDDFDEHNSSDVIEMYKFFCHKDGAYYTAQIFPLCYKWGSVVKYTDLFAKKSTLYPYTKDDGELYFQCGMTKEYILLSYWDGEMISHVYKKTSSSEKTKCLHNVAWDHIFVSKDEFVDAINKQESAQE